MTTQTGTSTRAAADAHARRMVAAIAGTKTDMTNAIAVLVANLATAAGKLEALAEQVTTQETALAALQAQVNGLAAQKSSGVSWAGIHAPGRRYAEGQLVTRSGSLWLARNSTTETPGSSASWTLVVKSGQVDR